jgi:hypothetical protein
MSVTAASRISIMQKRQIENRLMIISILHGSFLSTMKNGFACRESNVFRFCERKDNDSIFIMIADHYGSERDF